MSIYSDYFKNNSNYTLHVFTLIVAVMVIFGKEGYTEFESYVSIITMFIMCEVFLISHKLDKIMSKEDNK